ncbi:hypothetical protein BU23DRAFT_51957 [Bimuria novae-zelandiae CBS 107.79]|uniref:Uncharacterized protein n=1 Tax=Bimuria novae-zelandiae CBS 107.79 TaxID=1447943 RepID=A0A6A5UJ01_9PLEO|nr:hypothetical protein BU23DRAFT_51957 [Bimuria novae-zelandiae CBS 107.79]
MLRRQNYLHQFLRLQRVGSSQARGNFRRHASVRCHACGQFLVFSREKRLPSNQTGIISKRDEPCLELLKPITQQPRPGVDACSPPVHMASVLIQAVNYRGVGPLASPTANTPMHASAHKLVLKHTAALLASIPHRCAVDHSQSDGARFYAWKYCPTQPHIIFAAIGI